MRLTFAAAIFGSIIGMKYGLTRIPPRLTSSRALSSVVGKPPLPLPITTPRRSSSSADKSSPASSIASAAAAIAICENRAIRRASRGLTYFPASKSGTSPATLHGYAVGSASVIPRMPDLPRTRLSQYSFTDSPSGVTAPIPVTTTRLRLCSIPASPCQYRHINKPKPSFVLARRQLYSPPPAAHIPKRPIAIPEPCPYTDTAQAGCRAPLLSPRRRPTAIPFPEPYRPRPRWTAHIGRRMQRRRR